MTDSSSVDAHLFDPERRGSGMDYGLTSPLFTWLEADDREGVASIRDQLEAWLTSYPTGPDRQDVTARLKSTEDDEHREALLELWTHEILRRLGQSPLPHPSIEGTQSRPDFGATHETVQLYVECASSRADSNRSAEEKRQNIVLDLIDALEIDNFTLDAAFRKIGPEQPSTRKLRAELVEWVNALNHAEAIARLEAQGPGGLDTHLWSHEGWEIEFAALPLQPADEHNASAVGGAVGISQSTVFTVTTPRRLRSTVRKKQSWYGNPDRPLVLVLTTGVHATEQHLIEALFGDQEWHLDRRSDHFSIELTRNGAWRTPGGLSGQRLSGILFKSHLQPWELCAADWSFIHHPDPVHPAPSYLFPFAKEVIWEDGRAQGIAPQIDLCSLFELPNDWPGFL